MNIPNAAVIVCLIFACIIGLLSIILFIFSFYPQNFLLASFSIVHLLTGTWAIVKTCQTLLGYSFTNCFLAESFLLTAILAEGFTLIFQLTDLQKVTVLVLLWNFSFGMGFAPLLGWNQQYLGKPCDWTKYYQKSYLVIMTTIIIMCGVMHLIIAYKIRPVYSLLNQVISFCLINFTLFFYVSFNCSSCPGKAKSIYLTLFVPILITKALFLLTMQLICYLKSKRKRKMSTLVNDHATIEFQGHSNPAYEL